MTAIIGLGGILILLGMLLYFAQKTGVDKAENRANKEALQDVVEANKPVTDAERARVVQLFRRD